MQILAPCAGRVISMSDVDDPVFSEQLVGPGVGIEPTPGPSDILAPADGLLLKLNPHAFILLVDGSVGVLVHVGLNTVELNGQGFELLAEQGQTVTAGTPVVAWNPDTIVGDGISTTVVVAVMDQPPDSIASPVVGETVGAGAPLFSID